VSVQLYTPQQHQKCLARNRIAARRDGINAVPMKILASAPVAPPEADLRYAHGALPATPEAALARINQLLPDGAPALTPDDVYLHYVEAGNNAFIPSYFMFLSDTTLRNIAQDATAGFAFMNSHRTGGMSTPTELPFGRTFAGRYEEYKPVGDAPPLRRTLIGFYMRQGVQPNGAQGPSTDDLHAAILAATLFDVSLGIGGGQSICDVCGNELRGPDCSHAPGTHRNMTSDNKTAQRARGVPQGLASYTLDDAHANEVSGVYDGAVPGAGFRKTLSLARQRNLSALDILQARAAYGHLLRKGDLPMDQVDELLDASVERILARRDGAAESHILTGVTELRTAGPDPETERALAAERERTRQLEARLAKVEATAREDYVTGLITSNRLLPAARQGALLELAQAAADDAARPDPIQYQAPDGTLKQGSRVDAVKARLDAAPPHKLTEETLPNSAALFGLGAGSPPTATDQAAQEAREVGRKYGAATNGATANGHQ
jgi:hypothetical protein